MSSTGELSFELYKWLSSLQIITSGQKYKPNGNIQLDSRLYEELVSGQLMSKLVQTLAKQMNVQLNGALLSSIKKSNTPASRVYNWNVLSESFGKIGVTLSKQRQKQITTGNFEQLKRFLIEVQRKTVVKKLQKPQQQQQPKQQQPIDQLDFPKIQKYTSYQQCETVLQAIVRMISKSCGLTPKQSFSTLGDNLKYFSHMIVKGLKNSFDQIVAFFRTMIQQMPQLMYLAQKDPANNTGFLLQLVKPSLISRQPQVALFGSNALCAIIYESMKYNQKNLVFQVLSGQQNGFDFLYMGIKRHPHLVSQYMQFLHPLITNTYKQFFQLHLRSIINNQGQYIRTIIILLQGIRSSQEARRSVIESGLLKQWVKMCQEEFNNNNQFSSNNKSQFLNNNNNTTSPNSDSKILSLQLLCDLWKMFSSELNEQQAQGLLMRGIEQLKRNTRKDNYLIKVSALNRLFDFLDFLAQQKNRLAAIVYKKTIFLLFENHNDLQLRQVILQNFMLTLKKFPTIPVQFLLGPLLRQLQKEQGDSYILNIFDFQFFVQLFKHPRVQAQQALNYLQYFTKLYTKNIIYSKLVIRVIQLLCARFWQQQTIMQYIVKNAENNLNTYGMLAIGKKQFIKDREEKLMNSQKKSLVIELLKYYIKLENQFINDAIRTRVLKMYVTWLDTKKHDDKGLYYLLTFFGDVDQLVMRERIQKRNQKFDQSIVPVSTQRNNSNRERERQREVMQKDSFTPNSFSPFFQSPITQKNQKSRKLLDSDIWRQDTYINSNRKSNNQSLQLQPRQAKKSSQRSTKPQGVDSRALQNIEIYRSKFRKQSQKRKQLLQRSNTTQLIPKANQTQLMQRQIALGYNKVITPQHLLYQLDSVKTKYLKEQTQMIQLSQMQHRDILSVTAMLKRYQKQLQTLFYKYTAVGTANNRPPTQQKVFMSFSDLNRMLKEKNLNKLPKIVINEIITYINRSKTYNINVLVGVEEKEFSQFLVLFTNLYLKEDRMDKDQPFGFKLEKVIMKLFEGEWFARDLVDRKAQEWFVANDIQKLDKEQQQRVAVPEGYKKVLNQEAVLNYTIPNAADFSIPQSYSVCLQVLNDIFNQKLKIDIFPPVTILKPITRIIPILKAPKLRIPQTMTEKLLKRSVDSSSQPNKLNAKAYQKVRQNGRDQLEVEFNPNINLKTSPSAQISRVRRSSSQKALKKKSNKVSMLNSDEIIKKHKQQEQYAKKLREQLKLIKKQKQEKQQDQKQKKQVQDIEKLKKQQKHKKYLEENKKKVQEKKEKQEQQKKQLQIKEQEQKQKKKLQAKEREKSMLQKMQKQILVKKEKFDQKQKSREKHLKKQQIIQKKAKNAVNQLQKQPNSDKQKEKRLWEQITKGQHLMPLVSNYDPQTKTLFESYWNWKSQKIELKDIALMMKNFKVSPEYLSPKIIAETFKTHAKGDSLGLEEFKQLLVKYCYKSQKLREEVKNDGGKEFDPQVLKNFLEQRLCMKTLNYVQKIKKAKLQQL